MIEEKKSRKNSKWLKANQLTNLQALPKSPGLGNSHMKVSGKFAVSLRGRGCCIWSCWGIHSKAVNMFIHNDIT